ncbi:Protein T2 [Sarracenia purpurea var. burkii]
MTAYGREPTDTSREGGKYAGYLELKLLVHHMGGSVRKEMHCKVTHLIAKLCSGEKYFYAMTFRVPVVSETWVHDAWKYRDVIGFNAAENDFVS